MRTILRLMVLSLAVTSLRTAGAADQMANLVRTGNHAGFGRIVFDLPPGTTARAVQAGARISVHLEPSGIFLFGAPPRNVLALTQSADGAEITLIVGSTMRQSRLGNRFVVDAAAPPRTVTPDAGEARLTARPMPRPGMSHSPPPDGLARARDARLDSTAPLVDQAPKPIMPTGVNTAQAAVPEASTPTPAKLPDPMVPVPPAPSIGSLALAARPATPSTAEPDAQPGDPALVLPFAATTGAAVFRRGDTAFVVFDERRPIDMAGLRDNAVFAAATIALLPEATLLRIPVAAQTHLTLARTQAGWSVAVRNDDRRSANLKPFTMTVDQGRLMIAADQAGRVISVPDPLTGGVVLVGTQRVPGQGMPVARSTPEFGVLETWQGVAIVPVADALRLNPVAAGFVLALDPPRPLAMSAVVPQTISESAAQGFSRRFDFPNLPIDQLQRRLQSAVAEASMAPPQSRGRKRIAAAEAMIALGLGVEAQALLTLAATDDATLADDRDRMGLSAIAALVAGRLAEAEEIGDPRLDGTDDVTLWRAIRIAKRSEGAPAAAAQFATVSRLLLNYPTPLRGAFLPLVVETMVLGGEAETANVLAKTNINEPGLDFARALLASSDPARLPIALQSLDRLTASRDRLLHTRAATKAIELRLAAKMITPGQAAAAMERQIYAWRGDERELATRLRVADLHADNSAWRPALRLLRETAEIWPTATATLQPRLVGTLMRALATDAAAPLPPLELLALAEENADLIGPGEEGEALATRLADRLIALDLPQRAIPLLTRVLAQSEPGTPRSEIGAKLAAMQMQMDKPEAALAALADTLGVGSLPLALLEHRTLLYARAASAVGRHDQAIAVLEALDTLAAVTLQAELQEASKNWTGTMQALQHLIAMSLPQTGRLDDAQSRTVLRFASAAAQAGDAANLNGIRIRDLPRMPAGKTADLTRLLTSSPVQKVGDLARSAQDSRSLAAAVKGAGN